MLHCQQLLLMLLTTHMLKRCFCDDRTKDLCFCDKLTSASLLALHRLKTSTVISVFIVLY